MNIVSATPVDRGRERSRRPATDRGSQCMRDASSLRSALAMPCAYRDQLIAIRVAPRIVHRDRLCVRNRFLRRARVVYTVPILPAPVPSIQSVPLVRDCPFSFIATCGTDSYPSTFREMGFRSINHHAVRTRVAARGTPRPALPDHTSVKCLQPGWWATGRSGGVV